MPIPRFTYMPSRNSRAMRLAMPNLSKAIAVCFVCSFSLFFVREPYGTTFDTLFIAGSLKDAMDIDAGDMDLIRVQLTGLDEVFDFRDGDVSRFGHGSGEIAGGLAEDQITKGIAFPGFYDGKIRMQCQFHEIGLSIEFPNFFTRGYFGAISCPGKKSGYPHPGH